MRLANLEVVGSLALVLALVGACADMSRDPGADATQSEVPMCPCGSGDAPVVDTTLLAFLSAARSAHHKADLSEKSEDTKAAIAVLDQLVAGPRPDLDAPEIAEVLADTHARLADLRSADGDFQSASEHVDEGLKLAERPTHFRGHLFEVRGLVEERRASALDADGKADEAKRARELAVESFEKAIDIQEQVITEALSEVPAPAPK